jgi:AcrR family transcriptional regulator
MTLIAEVGLGASTAEIARRAGIPSGSVFTYFDTKAALVNAVYLALKTELTTAVLVGLPANAGTRERLQHVWMMWTQWGARHPMKRKALALLSVSTEVSDDSRKAAMAMASPTVAMVAEVSAHGALAKVSPRFVGALVESLVGTTTDHMIANPKEARLVARSAFDGLWRLLS